MDRAAVAALMIAAAGTGGALLYLRSRQQGGQGGEISAPELSGQGLAPGALDFGLGLGDPLAAVQAFAQSTAELVGISQPRGIRNRNPGNVKRGDRWLGLAPPDDQTDPVFWRFASPDYGIRVIAYLLLGYQSRKGKRTVRQLISENGGWAPTGSADKNPAEYADFVARKAGVGVDQPIDLASSPAILRAIVVAIISFENGGYSYPAGVVDAGIAMARS